MKADPRLALDLAGIKMHNPLIAASGCYGYGFDYAQWVDPRDWGAIVLQGTTLEPRSGNPPPRLAETPSGMLNAIGLQNPGIAYFLKEVRPQPVSYTHLDVYKRQRAGGIQGERCS